MTRRIKTCERDQAALNKLRQLKAAQSPQPTDYLNRVVVKPWGYEFLIFENPFVAIWFLHIKNGHSTSMHCHPGKKTSLALLKGEALCNTFDRRNFLRAPDAVVIDKGVFHSTKGASADGIYLIEVETPPNKTDLVRLNDEYGRESAGYEGLTEMKTEDLHRFGYFHFNEEDPVTQLAAIKDGFEISLHTDLDTKQFRDLLNGDSRELFSCCRGQVLDLTGQIVVDLGEVADGAQLGDPQQLRISQGATLLRMRPVCLG